VENGYYKSGMHVLRSTNGHRQ